MNADADRSVIPRDDPQHDEIRRAGVQRIVQQRLIRHLFESARSTLLIGLLVACVVFYAVWRTTGSSHIALWLVGVVVVTVLRLMSLSVLQRRLGDREARVIGYAYAATAFVAGSTWAAIALFDSPSHPVGARLMILLTLVSMPVASLSSNATHLPAYYAFTLPIFTSMFYWAWTLIPEMAFEFTLLALSYIALVSIMANRYNQNLKRSLIREIENEMLLHEVNSMNEELHRLAYQDPLTGLSNRRSFEESTNLLIRRRRNTDQLALMLIDLDKFKSINDTLGHAAGDAVLIELSRRIAHNSRISEVVAQTQMDAARIGGDEFIVVYRLDASIPVEPLATRILEALMAPMAFGNEMCNPCVSIGIAIAPTHANELESLLRAADAAMYAAKSAGGGRFVIAPTAGDAHRAAEAAD